MKCHDDLCDSRPQSLPSKRPIQFRGGVRERKKDAVAGFQVGAATLSPLIIFDLSFNNK